MEGMQTIDGLSIWIRRTEFSADIGTVLVVSEDAESRRQIGWIRTRPVATDTYEFGTYGLTARSIDDGIRALVQIQKEQVKRIRTSS